ncbi:MAG: hypothetical protein AAF289_14580 [Cyanobacteria bacterium P01_A01_bin.135]
MKRLLLSLLALSLLSPIATQRAVAQTDLPTVPVPETAPEASSEQPESAPPEPAAPGRSQQTQFPDCPPGQFASAFSDVLPTHWAYQAVLNLAATPIRCFDLPADSTSGAS